jgi:vacuolar-type H+-ATPase subunit H
MSDYDQEFSDFDSEYPDDGTLYEPQPGPDDSEGLLQELYTVVSQARQMPLSASAMINREEVLGMIDHAIARLPEELRTARWLLKERDDVIAKAQREADDILEEARIRAGQMVERQEVVRAANSRARQVLEKATDEARQMRLEVEDFCDHRLANFEIVLEKTLKTVNAGRERLQLQPSAKRTAGVEETDEHEDDANAFFDQDLG